MSNGGMVDYDDSKRNTRDSTQAVTTAIDAALDAETRAKEEKRFGRKVKGGQKTLTLSGALKSGTSIFTSNVQRTATVAILRYALQ